MKAFFKSKKTWLFLLLVLGVGGVFQVKYGLLPTTLGTKSNQNVPLKEPSDEEPELPPDLLYKGRPLEAYCLGEGPSQEKTQISLSECMQQTKEMLINLSPPKSVNGWWGYNDDYKNKSDYIYYKYLGTLSNGDHLIFKMNGCYIGTGRFSSIMALHRDADTLTLSLIDGGDRAFGGVEEATFEKGVLRYTKSLTPLALYHLWCAFSKAPQEAGLDISSLADCAVCQAGYASYEVPDKDLPAPPQEKHIVHFYLSRSIAPNVPPVSDPNTLQDCFDQILEEYENRGMTEFLWEDLDGFFQEVIAFYKKQSLFKPKTLRSSGRTKKSAIKRR